jgi:hypothetical protein
MRRSSLVGAHTSLTAIPFSQQRYTMLDPPNGNAFSAAANGLNKRIQRSNPKKSEPQDF